MNVTWAIIGSWCIVRVAFSANLRTWCFRDDCCLVITGDKIPEVEPRTQGSRSRPRTQKNPRPRIALPRTDPLEAKDRNAWGQGQGPRTQRQVLSKKKGLQKSFLDDLQFIGVPRIFDWRRPKSQITCNEIIKNFPNRKFLWDNDMKRWKIWNRCLSAGNRILQRERGIKLILEKRKYITLETC